MDAQQLSLKLQADNNFRFEHFVVSGNEALVEQLKKITRRQLLRAQQMYLYAPPASGKTHLLQAACRQASEQGHSSVYVPLSVFRSQGPAILQGLDQIGFIAMDECDTVLSDRLWQEQIFALINAARARQHCVVMAGRSNPATMQLTLRDLQSRLVWGGVYAVQALSDTDKPAVLTRIAGQAGYKLSSEALRYLLHTYPRDLSSLLALLQRLLSSGQPRNRIITIPWVKRVLEK